MSRLISVCLVLLVPAVVSAETEKKDKPGFIGVQLRADDQKDPNKKEVVILVVTVINNSPAEEAGLKSGDRIVRINGVKPVTLAATVKVVRLLKPGKKAKFIIERDGKEKTLEIVPTTLE